MVPGGRGNLTTSHDQVGATSMDEHTATDDDDTMDAPVDKLATDDDPPRLVVWNLLEHNNLLLNSSLN